MEPAQVWGHQKCNSPSKIHISIQTYWLFQTFHGNKGILYSAIIPSSSRSTISATNRAIVHRFACVFRSNNGKRFHTNIRNKWYRNNFIIFIYETCFLLFFVGWDAVSSHVFDTDSWIWKSKVYPRSPLPDCHCSVHRMLCHWQEVQAKKKKTEKLWPFSTPTTKPKLNQ